jgi:hypothetical protein
VGTIPISIPPRGNIYGHFGLIVEPGQLSTPDTLAFNSQPQQGIPKRSSTPSGSVNGEILGNLGQAFQILLAARIPQPHKAPVIDLGRLHRVEFLSVHRMLKQTNLVETQSLGPCQTFRGEKIGVVIKMQLRFDFLKSFFGFDVPAKHAGNIAQFLQSRQFEPQPAGKKNQVRSKGFAQF